MLKIAIHGVNGRMGKAVAKSTLKDPDCILSAVSVRGSHQWYNKPLCGVSSIPTELKSTDNLDILCQQSEVIIDFTRPDATLALLPICTRYDRPVVIGTTGFHEEAIQWIKKAASNIPIVLAPNTSLGVNILIEVTRQVSKLLSPEQWDVEILEAHHRRKIDSPSGTALKLGEVVAQAQNSHLFKRQRYPNQGQRNIGDIGFSVIRGGEICGEHTVFFISDAERLSFAHQAQNRTIFAQGALVAAKWLIKQRPGLYSMADVLGFQDA